MANSTQKWLIGCGTGCAVIVVLIVALVTGTVMYVRGKLRPLQDASESRDTLSRAYGAREDFIPSSDGTIGRERMDIFLAVRESLAGEQARLDTALRGFDFDRLKPRQSSFREALRTLNDLSNLLTPAGEYVTQRNRMLLERKMGLGEYSYIYTMGYHSWLGHPPDDGPPIFEQIRARSSARSSGGDTNLTPEAVRRQYRRLIIRLLENQLRSVRDAGTTEWRRTLQQEIDRINGDTGRIAWQDNLPPQLEASLKPYRTRLEASYHSSTNWFELLTLDENRQFEWNIPANKGERGKESSTDKLPAEEPVAIPGSGGGTRNATEEGEGPRISYVVGGGVTAPVLLAHPSPPYTEEARSARAEGLVVIQCTVRKNGSIENIKVVRGLGYGLDESAINTITSSWKFNPGTLNGNPVDVQARIEIGFKGPAQ
jgi:TonB family protein